MAEENSNVSCSVETEKTITSVHHPEVVDIMEGAGDAIQSTEENVLSGAVTKFLLPENTTSSEGPKSTTEENSSPSEEIITSTKTIPSTEETIPSTEETIPCTEETISYSEENSPAPEVISCDKETSSALEQVISAEKEISYPAEEMTPCTEEACLSSELAMQSAQKNNSSAVETMSFHMQPNLPCEQTVTIVQETIASNEKINQPTEEMVLPTENAKSSTAETAIPEVTSIQSTGPESEITSSSSLIDEEIILQSSPLENSTDGEITEMVPAVEGVILLPPEEANEKKEAERNVINHNADENSDEMEADEEISSEEFQQRSNLESPSTSPILSSQPESPTNTDCAEEQSRPSRRPDITKHSYSRYNTVSYRKIKKGNTKQRIDEFESMLQIN
ncbi:ermin-like [Pristis pectinata]|uniref:ermin-like n=1 Tax=Pristis pectinata TaxID=685728 RepID=UPI00223DB248|nr:ermin-like [Pristis pectinata]